MSIYTDSKPGIYIERSNRIVSKIGDSGGNECEYEAIKSVDYENGYVYVLDDKNGSVIKYNVEDEKCISDYRNKELVKFGSIEVVDDRIFLIRGRIHSNLEQEEKILYEKRNEKIEEIGLNFSDLEGPFLSSSTSGPTLSVSFKSNLYFHVPFGGNVWKYDLNESRFTSTNVGRRSPEGSNPGGASTFQGALNIVRSSEMIFDLNIDKEHIYFSSKKKSRSKNPWAINIVSGNKYYKSVLSHRPYHISHRSLETIGMYESGKFTYKKVYYNYEL